MDLLFLKFLVMFLLSLVVVSAIIWFIYKQKTTGRDFLVACIYSVTVAIVGASMYLGIKLNEELDGEIKLYKDRVSYINYMDTTINDSVLYSMIKNLRIPHAKIVFAQAKLESANYKSELYKSNYNLFGMRYATVRPTITNNESMGYQKYDNWKESLVDYLIWQFSNKVDKLSTERYLEYLSAVYAEDPSYIVKVKKIIENTNFEKLK